MNLQGKKILLGITGGIAAYKACELLRVFQKRGAEVRVVMTKSATKFVGENTFAALTNFPVYIETAAADSKPFQHIDYPRWADIFVVAPCSATSISRFAVGTGEEAVSLCFLAMQGEKWIAPSMNYAMHSSPAVQRNLEVLRKDGVKIIDPAVGRLACGEEGAGKFPDPSDIADEIEFGSSGEKTLLITIGRTEEAIDPVRYISNRSSGKTGAAIVKEFLRNGCKVIAVCGQMEAKLPKQCDVVKVCSAEEMNKAVMEKQSEADFIAHCAAVADYRPKNAALQKIKDSKAVKILELEENPNILKNTIKNKTYGQKIISFALETENTVENALAKFNAGAGGIDLLVANAPVNAVSKISDRSFDKKCNCNVDKLSDSGFGKDSVVFAIIDGAENFKPQLQLGTKEELARQIYFFTQRTE